MLIFGEIWKKMETFGKKRKLSTKKRPEGRDAFHRGMLINVPMRQCANVPMKLAN
jgi:hypothetical protein